MCIYILRSLHQLPWAPAQTYLFRYIYTHTHTHMCVCVCVCVCILLLRPLLLLAPLTYAAVCCHMLTYADVCCRMLTYAAQRAAAASFSSLRALAFSNSSGPLDVVFSWQCQTAAIKMGFLRHYVPQFPGQAICCGIRSRMLTYADACFSDTTFPTFVG